MQRPRSGEIGMPGRGSSGPFQSHPDADAQVRFPQGSSAFLCVTHSLTHTINFR